MMIGRAYLWGLGANGQAGVENVLDLMRSGIDALPHRAGHSPIAELSPEDLVIPPGFTDDSAAETCVTLLAPGSFSYWE